MIVVALGGNALLRRDEPVDADTQRRNAAAAARALAGLAAEHEIVVTHGNGPQVGLLAGRDLDTPLDVLGAESEGMIGYLLIQALSRELPDARIVSLLTQTVVAEDSDAKPVKFVGPRLPDAEAERLRVRHGWCFERDGDALRRVVPSPTPLEIVELPAIRLLCAEGFLVVCAGGGGVPVVRDTSGRLRGIEGVADKDRTSALLAEALGAEGLLLLTDVDAVYRDWGTPAQRPIARATPEELARLDFDPGSMGPKVEAACRFARTGGWARIGALEDAARIARGGAGTSVAPG